jgi:ligand-binding sensor domain-containing protein/signal transduction histidine kinase/DNA-binding response OmpR family regulator
MGRQFCIFDTFLCAFGRLYFTFFCWLIGHLVMAHGVGFHEFKSIDRRMGLDASPVNCVVQDFQGLIWFGTNRGLYSFDGNTTRLHANDANNHRDVIYCALMVDTARIWLGSDMGLLVFNAVTEQFENAPPDLPADIRALCRIDDQSLWIGSIGGLYKYHLPSRRLDKISHDLLPHPAIYSILKYRNDRFFFGTYDGLCEFDTNTAQFKVVPVGNRQAGNNQLVLSLLADDKRHAIWVGLQGELVRLNPDLNQWSPVRQLFGNSVKSMLLDNQNCLWIATDNGLYIVDPDTNQWRQVRHNALNDRSLVNNIVWTIFADRHQNIWLGTETGVSLYSYHPNYKIQSISELTSSTEGNHIISVLNDSKGNLWLGGTNGLIKVDATRKKYIWYQHNHLQYPLPHNKVRHVFEDSAGDIWIATDGSVCMYHPQTEQFKRFQIEDDTGLRNANWAYAISQDEMQRLWIATCFGGVFVVDMASLKSSKGKTIIADRNYYTNDSPNALSGNMLQFVMPDANKNMWIGTFKAGLNKIDHHQQRVFQFLPTSPTYWLPSTDVTAMVTDSQNHVWVALRNQVVRLDINSHQTQIISDVRLNDAYIHGMADDGKRIWLASSQGLYVINKLSLELLQLNAGSSYYSSVHYDTNEKKIVAGGINEYIEFYPDLIAFEELAGRLYFTALWINDQLVDNNTHKSVFLSQSIRHTQHIHLAHNHNNIAMSFSSLRYNLDNPSQYAYKLQGLDSDWRFTSLNRIAYNNLSPGKYTLWVSSLNALGQPANNPVWLTIVVKHPWYSTLLAKIVYSILFVAFVLIIVNYFVVLNRLRFERLEKLKTLELSAHKIEFLTNISHELKTPLSLIVGPLSQIIQHVKSLDIKQQLVDVRQHAQRLNTLIHQLMNAARDESDGFDLVLQCVDFNEFVDNCVLVYQKAFADKQIKLLFQRHANPISVNIDVMKMEAVIHNLLSNALKFSSPHTIVNVSINQQSEWSCVTVSDQGQGIPSTDLPFVFKRFYQSRHHQSVNINGSGVGLSIVKNYVELHRGEVIIESQQGVGTSVTVRLPSTHSEPNIEPQLPSQFNQTTQPDKPLVLVVEDNLDILNFIVKCLSPGFRCVTAHNGRVGFDMAMEMLPHVVVTDIMMPEMDGIELCKKLKSNVKTAAIPIVLLTAKDDKHTEMQGYKTGADGFISKPFEPEYLLTRVQQLLINQHHLVSKVRQDAILKPSEPDVVSADERFLAAITQIIEANITNSDMNVNLLSEKSGYNAKQVYRRIKALTGQTAVDYIRSVRLKKAALLLSKKTFTVAEVMYMVGFNNHSYFAKRFADLYAKTPKQYMDDAPSPML